MIKILSQHLVRFSGLAFRNIIVKTNFNFSRKQLKPPAQPIVNTNQQYDENQQMSKEQVLKTYLQAIPPYRLQQILRPELIDISQFTQKPSNTSLTLGESQQLLKKIKKSVHIIPIESLGLVLQIISPKQNESNQCRLTNRKIYTKILNTVKRKLNVLSLEQIVNFMYKLVKMNYKQFQFMKQVEKIIIQEKIKINYPMIKKILWSYTHLDVGSAVLYSHISKTLKIGQHQFSPLQLAQSAYMLSKASQNATGGYGIFLIAQKHLIAHFSRLDFHELAKAASYMLTQNIGTNQFQIQLERQLSKKYPDHSKLRINDLVMLLKATSAYYFKYKDNSLLYLLQTSTRKLASEANLQQFQDIIWSWGRAGKGDRQLWDILEQLISRKYINLLKPRQLAFFYYSLCSTEYSSSQAIRLLQKKFMQKAKQKTDINEHYLLKFLLGMQKRKDYSESAFAEVGKMLTSRLAKLSTSQLITFAKIINESDICYQNKEKWKDMQTCLLQTCKQAIAQKIYLFRINQIIQILYMWIKLDISNPSHQNEMSANLAQTLFSHIQNSTHQIPKSVFIKALFCMTIKDKYKQAVQMIVIMQQLMKFGSAAYFFSPFQLPLAAYSIFHLIINSGGKIKVSQRLVDQLGEAIDKINPVILNKFARNGYEETLKLKQKYYEIYPKTQSQRVKNKKSKKT